MYASVLYLPVVDDDFQSYHIIAEYCSGEFVISLYQKMMTHQAYNNYNYIHIYNQGIIAKDTYNYSLDVQG